MKHLKKFNDNESLNFYSEITSEEYYIRFLEKIRISNKDVEYVSNTLGDININLDIVLATNYIDVYDKSKRNSMEIFTIIKSSDEWYIIESVKLGRYYKCDQIDGLSKFLKDKLK